MVYIDSNRHAVIVLRMVTRTTTYIYIHKCQGKIKTVLTCEFKKQFTKVDRPAAEVAEIWLRSTIKLTDRVKKELIMTKKNKTAVEQIEAEGTESINSAEGAETTEPKKRNYAKKGEGKHAYIAPDAVFKALENKRHRGESIRVRVWQALDKYESATCADIAKDLEMEEKVVIGNLRSLVADG